ncbi:MAG: hypothetical protein GY850_26800 [bacterium]|nr:hypothetical protein [bacterium]
MAYIPHITAYSNNKVIFLWASPKPSPKLICAALIGLILIIIGKGRAEHTPLWDPPGWSYHVTQIAMLALWALSHLPVNGDLASMVLFGGFGTFALFDMWSSNRRGAIKSNQKVPIYRDIVLVALGAILFSIILHLHPYFFGVSAVP